MLLPFVILSYITFGVNFIDISQSVNYESYRQIAHKILKVLLFLSKLKVKTKHCDFIAFLIKVLIKSDIKNLIHIDHEFNYWFEKLKSANNL